MTPLTDDQLRALQQREAEPVNPSFQNYVLLTREERDALVAEVRRLRETVAEMTLRRDMSAQHPSCYMREEMDERCWGIGDLVFQMGPCSKQEWGIRALALQMYFAVGPNEPGMRLGEAAKDYARAFGVSEDLFTNLETAWLDKVSALPRSGAPDAQE